LTLKLALDSRVLALVLVSRIQASASALKGPGLGLGLESPGLGLGIGFEGHGLGLVFGLWILALTTTLTQIDQFIITPNNFVYETYETHLTLTLTFAP